MPQSKPGKRLGDLGSVQAPSGVLLAVPDLRYAERQEIASSFAGSCWSGEVQDARSFREPDRSAARLAHSTAQKDIPLHLWDAFRSVSDQSTNSHHPLSVSLSKCQIPHRSVVPDSGGHALQWSPPLLSAQQNLILTIICSFLPSLYFFSKCGYFSEGAEEVPISLSIRAFPISPYSFPHSTSCFNDSSCAGGKDAQLSPEPYLGILCSCPLLSNSQHLSAISPFYDGLKSSVR